MALRLAGLCVVFGLLVNACGLRSEQADDTVATTRASLTVPAGCATIDFDVDSRDRTAIALTFDDGPEYGGTTLQVLDILAKEGVRATFFINTDDAINVLASSSGRLAVQRMVAEGHEVGSHTVHHFSLALESTDVNAELSGVVSALRSIAPSALSTRLVRAPFGEPYFGPQETLDRVAPIVAQYGVHVGWNIDSRDWACASAVDPPGCVTKTVLDLVDAGRSGIVLLHSTRPATVAALPDLIAALRTRGKEFVSVESMVVAKYGKPSRRLFKCASDADCFGTDVCASDSRCAAPPPADAGAADTAVADTAVADTAVADTAVADTAVADTAVADTAVADTALADTALKDTTVADTSAPDVRLYWHWDETRPSALPYVPR